MKKIIYLAVGSALLFMACSKVKDEVAPTPPNPITTSSEGKTSAVFAYHNSTYLGSGQGCAGEAYNCTILDTVVVTPRFTKSTFDGMTAAAIGAYWSDPSMIPFCNQLPQQIVAKLQSGNYLMKGNFENSQRMNFIVGTTAPLSPQNFEFAIEFAK